MKYEIMFI